MIDAQELLDDKYIEVGWARVQEVLIELRDERISLLNRGNGLCVREKDGEASDIIRLGIEDCLRIGLKAMIQARQDEARLNIVNFLSGDEINANQD